MKKHLIIIMSMVAILAGLSECAGSEDTITLETAVDMALEKSFGIKRYRNSLERADADYRGTLADYRAKISLFLTAPRYSESVDEYPTGTEGIYKFAQSTSKTFNGDLTAEMSLPTDGSVSLSLNSQDWTQTSPASESVIFTNTARLALNQPLFTLNERRQTVKSASLNHEISGMDYDENVRQLVYNVTNAYYSVVKTSRQVEINRERVRQSEQSHNKADLKFQSGLIPEVEALELKVNLEQDRAGLASSIASLEKSEEYLKQLLRIDFDEEINLEMAINYRPIDIDMDKLIAYVLENSDDIRARKIRKDLSEISLRRAKKTKDFRIDLSTYVEYYGEGDGWSTSNDDFLRNRGVTVNVSVPIYDAGREKYDIIASLADLRNAELALEEEKLNLERNVRDAVRSINEAGNRVGILRESREVALKSYEISRYRFETGAITSQQLLDSQLALTNAKTNYLNALIDYELAKAELKKIIETEDLERFKAEGGGERPSEKRQP